MLSTRHNVTRVLSQKNRFWNDLRIVEQKVKYVLQVLERTEDIFLKESELGRKCEFTDLGNRKSHTDVCLKLVEAWLDIEVAYNALSIRSI